MLKKSVKVIVIMAIAAMMLFSACSRVKWPKDDVGNGAIPITGENGGLVIQKGEYIYFINGTETHTSDNEFGKVERGAIVRMSLTDPRNKRVVVPKIVYSGTNQGFYIFDDKIYYTTPSSEKEKSGATLSHYLDFNVCNLDGTGNKKIMHVNSGSYDFRLYQADGTVYIVYVDTGSDKIIRCNAKNGAKTTIAENFASSPAPVFDGEFIYYAKSVYIDPEDDKKGTRDVNRLFRMHYNGAALSDIPFTTKNGKELTSNGETLAYSISGLEVKRFGNDTTLFFQLKASTEGAKGIVETGNYTYSYTEGDDDILLLLRSTAEYNFGGKYYVSKNSFLGTKEIGKETMLCYYVKETGGAFPDFTVTPLCPSASKVMWVEGDFVFYMSSETGGSVLFKKQFIDNGDAKVNENEKGTPVTLKYGNEGSEIETIISTAGLKPKTVGNWYYFIRDNGPYGGFVYRLPAAELSAKPELISIIPIEVPQQS